MQVGIEYYAAEWQDFHPFSYMQFLDCYNFLKEVFISDGKYLLDTIITNIQCLYAVRIQNR